MKLTCTAACLECDWSEQVPSMKAADSATTKHERATAHATSWHCVPVKE
jgi:hypothetical protein